MVSSLDAGGAERVVVDLVNHLPPGIEPSVCCLERSGPMAAYLRPDVPVHEMHRRPGLRPGLVLRVARLIRSQRAAIVHTHNTAPGLYGALAGFLTRTPVLQTKHGMNLVSRRQTHVNRLAYLFTRTVVAVSGEARELALREAGGKTRVTVIDNGIDTSRFAPDAEARAATRAGLGLSPGTTVIGTVGRLRPEKNQSLLLRSFSELADPPEGPLALVIAGDGPELTALRDLAASLADPRIRLLGRESAPERLLAGLDLFVLPSLAEGLPVALLEAMAVGLPAIVSRVGAMPEVVGEGRAGLVVEPGSMREMIEALRRLATDPSRRAAMGREGRCRVLARYSAERMAADYEREYRALARGRGMSRW